MQNGFVSWFHGAPVIHTADTRTFSDNAWRKGAPVIQAQVALRTLTMELGAGVIVVAGQIVTLLKAALLSMGTGEYIIAGQDATLRNQRSMTAGPEAISVVGREAVLLKASLLSLEHGDYTVDGQDGEFVYFPVVGPEATYSMRLLSGDYVVEGQHAVLSRTTTTTPIPPTTGSGGGAWIPAPPWERWIPPALRPRPVLRALKMNCGKGNVIVTVSSIGCRVARKIRPQTGAISVRGKAALYNRRAIKLGGSLYVWEGNYLLGIVDISEAWHEKDEEEMLLI